MTMIRKRQRIQHRHHHDAHDDVPAVLVPLHLSSCYCWLISTFLVLMIMISSPSGVLVDAFTPSNSKGSSLAAAKLQQRRRLYDAASSTSSSSSSSQANFGTQSLNIFGRGTSASPSSSNGNGATKSSLSSFSSSSSFPFSLRPTKKAAQNNNNNNAQSSSSFIAIDETFFPFYPTVGGATLASRSSSSYNNSGRGSRQQSSLDANHYNSQNSNKKNNEMSMSQMIAMNAVGGAMTVGVVYALASTNLNALLLSGTGMGTPGDAVNAAEDFTKVSYTIVDAALPNSATDVVTVTFSEAVAAVVAALVSLSYSSITRVVRQPNTNSNTNQARRGPTTTRRRNKNDNDDDIQKAVNNGDFFLAQAAALPLLESLGLPAVAATTVGVLLAAIPAEIVKIASRKSKDKRDYQEYLLELLLQEEQDRKQQRQRQQQQLSALFSFFQNKNNNNKNKQKSASSQLQAATSETLDAWQKSVEENKKNRDESLVVDIVSDIIKWLGYSVLFADFEGTLRYNGLPLFPGVESAIFGVIATWSAQVYADILYFYFGFGGSEKQDQVRSRTLVSWACTYVTEGVYAAIFFGMYEFAQIPAKAAVAAFLSGGADACYGSQDFDVCLQAFESQNPPGASPEAQLRSLVTTLASIWNRYTPDSFSWTG